MTPVIPVIVWKHQNTKLGTKSLEKEISGKKQLISNGD